MLKRSYLFLLAIIVLNAGIGVSALADGVRVYSNPQYPKRKLSKQFSAGANTFGTTDPSPDGTPLTLTSATGRSNADGAVSVALTNGFTAPVKLTVYFWQKDSACWVRLGASAGDYAKSFDSHYTSAQFNIPKNTAYFILADEAVTGDVWVDGTSDPNNNNTASGDDH